MTVFCVLLTTPIPSAPEEKYEDVIKVFYVSLVVKYMIYLSKSMCNHGILRSLSSEPFCMVYSMYIKSKNFVYIQQ